MLSEKVRSTDFTWDDAKAKLKKDPRWDMVADLERSEMERLFGKHMGKGHQLFLSDHCTVQSVKFHTVI